jgi:hypothetical protein
MSDPRSALAVVVLACLAAVSVPGVVFAQLAINPGGGSGQGFGGRGSHHGGGRRQNGPPAATPALAPLPAIKYPWPRLDAGATLCRTEADLQQHQAAIAARLDGGTATEPSGCRLVQAMTAVTVLERHGSARTEVGLPGSSDRLGWTDALMPAEPPPPP